MTRAETYAKAADEASKPPMFAPSGNFYLWKAQVDNCGNLHFNQQYLAIDKTDIPAFIEWLRDTFIYQIDQGCGCTIKPTIPF